jgi:hypothetical protein
VQYGELAEWRRATPAMLKWKRASAATIEAAHKPPGFRRTEVNVARFIDQRHGSLCQSRSAALQPASRNHLEGMAHHLSSGPPPQDASPWCTASVRRTWIHNLTVQMNVSWGRIFMFV